MAVSGESSVGTGADDGGQEQHHEETDDEESASDALTRYLHLRSICPSDHIQRPVRGSAPLYDKDFVMQMKDLRLPCPVDWQQIDLLNALVPRWARFTVYPDLLLDTFQNRRGDRVGFVRWYRDWALTNEHTFKEILSSPEYLLNAHVMQQLPDINTLGQSLLSDDTWLQHWHKDATNYFHHLFAKHAGEVVMVGSEERQTLLAGGGGRWSKRYFHPQYAIKGKHRVQWYEAEHHKSAAGDILTAAEAAQIGSTTFMEFSADGAVCKFKVAKVMSLSEFFVWGHKDFTALELYFYYNNCLKMVKKRRHAWASKEQTEAAHVRFNDRKRVGRVPRFGHYRHMQPPAAAGARCTWRSTR